MREALYARRLGYLWKALVRSEHAQPLNAALTPSGDEVLRATAIVDGFEAARARGEDRALIDDLWVEVPTYGNARRLIERARRLSGACCMENPSPKPDLGRLVLKKISCAVPQAESVGPGCATPPVHTRPRPRRRRRTVATAKSSCPK